MRAPDGIPTDFEAFIVKWIAIPLLLLSFCWLLFNTSSDSRQCKKACYAEGFDAHRYRPSGKYGSPPAACYCLTAEAVEEAANSNRIPKGQSIPFK